MGQIDDIMKDIIKASWIDEKEQQINILRVEEILEKHLEPQKKAEVCKSCLGKKQLSEYKGVTVACADFPGDKSYIVDKGGIVIADCSRCKGTGEEPIYIPELQQEDNKTEEYIPRCIKCGNSIKWDYDDEYCCECGAKFKQQEDKKIELLSGQVWIGQDIPNKINEIINYINLHLDHKSL